MNRVDQLEWHRLFNAALNDQLSETEKLELAVVLKSSAEARQLWYLYNDNECSLVEIKIPVKRELSRFTWKPLAAAMAGVVLGMFCPC